MVKIGDATLPCHVHVQGNISFDGDRELLFSGSAERLKDYVPPVEDGHPGGKHTQKISPKTAPPKSSAGPVEDDHPGGKHTKEL